MVSKLTASLALSVPSISPVASCRVRAASMAGSGFREDTDQSLPAAMRAPARSREPMGYIPSTRSAPIAGRLMSVM